MQIDAVVSFMTWPNVFVYIIVLKLYYVVFLLE